MSSESDQIHALSKEAGSSEHLNASTESGSLAAASSASCKRKRARGEFPWNYTHEWVEGDHKFLKSKRQCTQCRKSFSHKTNASGWRTHLREQHFVIFPETGNMARRAKEFQQQPVVTSFPPRVLIEFENAVVDFVVKGSISLRGAGGGGFKTLVRKHSRGYEVPSTRSIIRRIVELYFIMLPIVSDCLNTLDVSFPITIDGWSNRNLKGFWMVTAHWVETRTATLRSVLLTILDVQPGRGVGKRIGTALLEFLRSLGASVLTKLLAVVIDNGSDAIKGGEHTLPTH
jgi:hypothetical protein